MRDSGESAVATVANTAPQLTGADQWTVDSTAGSIVVDGARHQLSGIVQAIVAGDGTICVVDERRTTVFLFDSTGAPRSSIGVSGQGPGEFNAISRLFRAAGDSILVIDAVRATRSSLHTLAGRSFPLPLGAAEVVGVFANGDLLTSAGVERAASIDSGPQGIWTGHSTLSVTDSVGNPRRVFGEFPNGVGFRTGEAVGLVVFGPRGYRAVAGNNVIAAYSDKFEISVLDSSAQAIRIIRRAWSPIAVSPEVRQKWKDALTSGVDQGEVAELREVARSAQFASHLPAHGQLLVAADGKLWVEHYNWRQDVTLDAAGLTLADTARWSIFDAAGQWRSDIVLPVGLRLTDAGSDYILGYTTDSSGTPTLRQYRITAK